MRLFFQISGLALVLALGGAAPAVAGPNLQVLDSDFQLLLTQTDGSVIAQSTTTIPLIPDASCFQWTVKVDAKGPLRIKEVLKLPDAPETWGEADDNEFSPTATSADRKSAVTTLFMAAKDGVLTNGWCIAAGDPVGHYRIEVFYEEQSLKTFEFDVVE